MILYIRRNYWLILRARKVKFFVRVFSYLGNEDVNASMLVIPPELVDGVSSMQYYLVFHYILSVSAPARGLMQPHCSPEQLVLQYHIIINPGPLFYLDMLI